MKFNEFGLWAVVTVCALIYFGYESYLESEERKSTASADLILKSRSASELDGKNTIIMKYKIQRDEDGEVIGGEFVGSEIE